MAVARPVRGEWSVHDGYGPYDDVGRARPRQLLVGKLAFRLREDARGRYYEFAGQRTLSGLLAGVICTDGLVTPAGGVAGLLSER